MSGGDPIIFSGSGLDLGWDRQPIARGVELSLASGEKVALLGPSGSGKSTLLRTLAGLIDALSGRLELHGRTPEQWGWPTWRRRVALVAQRPVVFTGSVLDNLRRPFGYRSATKPFPEELALTWLERLGLGPSIAAREAAELSVGQQQRVALVRSLLLEPEVILLDEPTSALDRAAERLAEELLDEVVSGGPRAALIVTHRDDQVRRWCHRSLDFSRFL